MSRLLSVVRNLQTAKSWLPVVCQQRLPHSHSTRSVFSNKHCQRLSSTASSEDSSRREFVFETRGSSRLRQDQDKASLVIFDKDGTLICFHSMWSQWTVKVTESIAEAVGLPVQKKLYEALGVCSKSKRIFPGLLAEMTTPVIQKELIKLLVDEGVPVEIANKAVVDCWLEGDSGKGGNVKSIHPELVTLFEILKANEIKIAICTADNRRGTLNTLRNLGLSSYVDMIVCGDDPNTQPKPSPHNAFKICAELGVDPQNSVMVGDTKADVGMGKAANLGWVVGVLSGVGDTEELLPEAGYIIDNVKDILPLILPYDDWITCYTYRPSERVLIKPIDLDSLSGLGSDVIDTENYDVIIFDLHGTLISSEDKYLKWLEKLTVSLEMKTGLKMAAAVYKQLGVCQTTGGIGQGLLAKGATNQLKEEIVKLLRSRGFHFEEAIITMNQVWEDCESHFKSSRLVSIDNDIPKLLSTLKENGLKVGINTTECREAAVSDLMSLGLIPFVDILVCGDDPISRIKPHPHNAILICEEMETTPDRAVVVGDTLEDITMGIKAKVGKTIGVLTGVGSRNDLVKADHIVPRASQILHHLHCEKDGHNSNSNDKNNDNKTDETRPSRSTTKDDRILSNHSPPPENKRPFSTSTSHHQKSKSKYDYVIIGGGSAGCVLANRLSANSQNRVLLVEAGPKDNTWKINMPAALMYNLCDDQYNWYYHTEPEPFMDNRVMYQPRGRVWGGSSSLNAMVYIRGHASDYDRWEEEGAKNWSYSHCLPYFRRSQTHEQGPDGYRGGDGPLHVSRGKTYHPLHQAFLEAGQQAGYPFTEDMNGYQQEGFGWMDMTINRGQRWSSASAYLMPAISRPNLDTINKTLTTRVLFNGKRAVGVEIEQAGQLDTIEADEVILSGGAVNSPQLLALSGVGDADDLKALDIPVVHHLPGVGKNLQDHLEIYIQQACTKPITLYSAQWKFPHNMVRIGLEWFIYNTGWGATTHLETGGFIRSSANYNHPNLQYHFLPSTVNDHGRKNGSCHAYQVHVGPLRATSRGSVTLKSRDPHQHPALRFNYLSTPEDVQEFRDAIRLTREIFAQKAFDPFRGPEISPGESVLTDVEIDAFVRQNADTAYHPSCTCKMGSADDPMAVVDPSSMRVYGLEGLRVVDASVMPSVASGNLNGPTIMLSEKAADIIQDKTPLPMSNAPVYKPADLNKQR